MLTSDRVVNYVKQQLGYPFVQVEFTDEQILEYIQEYSLRELSYYIPYLKRTYLSFSDTDLKVEGRQNEFFIQDEENLEIMNVREIYFDRSNAIMLGHPFYGVFSFSQLREFALNAEMAGMTRSFSDFDPTFEFRTPNIVRISPLYLINSTSGCTLEYECIQPGDFSGIPMDLAWITQEFCAADIMILTGRIRSKYSDGIKTPFGDININANILDEGKDKKREVIEKLQMSLPNIVIDIA